MTQRWRPVAAGAATAAPGRELQTLLTPGSDGGLLDAATAGAVWQGLAGQVRAADRPWQVVHGPARWVGAVPPGLAGTLVRRARCRATAVAGGLAGAAAGRPPSADPAGAAPGWQLAPLPDLDAEDPAGVLQRDGQRSRVLTLRRWPPHLDADVWGRLAAEDVVQWVAVHGAPLATDRAAALLRRRRNALAGRRHADRAAGRLDDPGVAWSAAGAEDLADAVAQGQTALVAVQVLLVVTAVDAASLVSAAAALRSAVASRGGALDALRWQQAAAWAAVRPGGAPLPRPWRWLDSAAAAACLPLPSTPPAALADPTGTLQGVDPRTGAPLWWDRLRSLNPARLVVGSSGSGKSFAVKLAIQRTLAAGGQVLVVDPEGEYAGLTAVTGGGDPGPGGPSAEPPGLVPPPEPPGPLPVGVAASDVTVVEQRTPPVPHRPAVSAPPGLPPGGPPMTPLGEPLGGYPGGLSCDDRGTPPGGGAPSGGGAPPGGDTPSGAGAPGSEPPAPAEPRTRAEWRHAALAAKPSPDGAPLTGWDTLRERYYLDRDPRAPLVWPDDPTRETFHTARWWLLVELDDDRPSTPALDADRLVEPTAPPGEPATALTAGVPARSAAPWCTAAVGGRARRRFLPSGSLLGAPADYDERWPGAVATTGAATTGAATTSAATTSAATTSAATTSALAAVATAGVVAAGAPAVPRWPAPGSAVLLRPAAARPAPARPGAGADRSGVPVSGGQVLADTVRAAGWAGRPAAQPQPAGGAARPWAAPEAGLDPVALARDPLLSPAEGVGLLARVLGALRGRRLSTLETSVLDVAWGGALARAAEQRTPARWGHLYQALLSVSRPPFPPGYLDRMAAFAARYGEDEASARSRARPYYEHPVIARFYPGPVHRPLLRGQQAAAARLALLVHRARAGALGAGFGPGPGPGDLPQLTVVDTSSVPDALRWPVAVAALWLAWAAARRGGAGLLVVIDEAHLLLADPDTAALLADLARRARKHGLALELLSQRWSDFAELPTGRAVVANAGTVLLLGAGPTERAAIQRGLQLSDAAVAVLDDPPVGAGLWWSGQLACPIQVVASVSEAAAVTAAERRARPRTDHADGAREVVAVGGAGPSAPGGSR